jgi:formylglycine-generating enzyme required for sulfatase activity
MRKNCKIYLAALLLVGATGMMTARAQGSGNKPTLAVFVVGGDNTLVTPLTTALGANLTSGGRYALTGVNTGSKLTELQATYAAGGGSSINRDALAVWGRDNGISVICLVVDDKNGNDHLFSAQLIDAKDSQLSGKGSYVRTSVAAGDATRIALALAQQLNGRGRRRSVPAPARTYPAELDIEMVFVEGGTFTMGCTAEQTFCYSDEKPTHSVTVSSFYIGKYEITQAQWKAVMKGHPLEQCYRWKGTNCGAVPCDDQRPVENVSWFNIDTAFLPRLRALTGKNYRLPREAEWEYAARGCKSGQCEKFVYSGSNDVNELGWHTGNSSQTTHPVGQKKPNTLGIYDMDGNVWELINDWVGAYSATAQVNPTGPTTGSNRMIRGGSWGNVASERMRVSSRHPGIASSYGDEKLGFRLVLPAQ